VSHCGPLQRGLEERGIPAARGALHPSPNSTFRRAANSPSSRAVASLAVRASIVARNYVHAMSSRSRIRTQTKKPPQLGSHAHQEPGRAFWIVEAQTEKAAELAAAEAFMLSERQRKRLLVRERLETKAARFVPLFLCPHRLRRKRRSRDSAVTEPISRPSANWQCVLLARDCHIGGVICCESRRYVSASCGRRRRIG
jgi:hypothetical protein